MTEILPLGFSKGGLRTDCQNHPVDRLNMPSAGLLLPSKPTKYNLLEEAPNSTLLQSTLMILKYEFLILGQST